MPRSQRYHQCKANSVAVQTYVELANIYETTMSIGVNRVIANGTANNADVLAEALTLYIIIVGLLMAFREMSYRDFIWHMMRAAIIAFLLTVQGFNTMIATPAMDTIPAWIAASSNNATGVTAGAQQFELLSSAVTHQTAAILQGATGLENIAYRGEAKFWDGAIKSLLTTGFWMYEFSRLIMGVLVAAMAFLLFLALFECTRHVPIRLANKALGLLILQLMLSIMIQIMLAGDSTFMIHVANGGLVADAGLDAQLGVLEDIFSFFVFGIGMIIFLPAIAAYVGGGIALGVGGAIVSRIPGAAGMMMGVAGRVGRAGSRAISRARR